MTVTKVVPESEEPTDEPILKSPNFQCECCDFRNKGQNGRTWQGSMTNM